MLHHYRKSILSLIEKVHRLSDDGFGQPALALEIQEQLILAISRIEQRIKKSKRSIKLAKQLLSTHQPKEKAQQLKRQVEESLEKVRQYHYISFIYRQIGDALAFVFIDRWNIKPMVFKEHAGSLTGKAGARFERKLLRELFKARIIVILNDVTNSLRYGDLTVPLRDGLFLLIEAKGNTRHNPIGRLYRQNEKLQRLSSYILTDHVVGLYREGQEMRRSALPTRERDHTAILNVGINTALREGQWSMQVEDGVYYIVETDDSPKRVDEIITSIGEPPVIFFLNMLKEQVLGYYPFILSIRSPEALYKFLAGELLITVIIAPSAIDARARMKQFSAEMQENYQWPLLLKDLSNPELTHMRFSWHYFQRLGAEFLSLDWFVEANIAHIKRLECDDAWEQRSCESCSETRPSLRTN